MIPVAVGFRGCTTGPGAFLVLTMRTAFGGLCLRRRIRLRSSTGRIPTVIWTSKVPPLLAVHAPAERKGLTTSHARTCKHVLVVLCMHRAADLGGTPDFEGLLVVSYSGKLLLDADGDGVISFKEFSEDT